MSRKTVEEMTNSFNQNPYLFIVGCPRSGTTLLQRMVDAHPHITITPEIHWITGNLKKRRLLTPEGLVTSELVSRLVEHRRFAQLEIAREDFEALIGSGAPVPYSTFLIGIFDLYRKLKNKRLVGNKTPAYVKSLPTLHALWPRAKFVHIIRDGRDVYLSIMNWKKADSTAGRFVTWTEDPVLTTALWWERKVRLGRQGGHPLGPELYYEMRYENLVTHPENECAKLCDFLGLPYDNAMLRFHEGRTRTDPGLSAKKAWLPITPGLRDWRSQMSAEDIERFEAVAGDLLNELGYSRAFPCLRPETLKHASRIRDLFTQDVRSRGNRLPERW